MSNQQQASDQQGAEKVQTRAIIEGIDAFSEHLAQAISTGRRTLDILTAQVDPLLFGRRDICELISALARSNRHAEVRILVKDVKPTLANHHPLIALHQKLISKIAIRQLMVNPNNQHQAYIVIDQKQLLLQHHDGEYVGFYDSQAAPQAQALLEEFNELWRRQSSDILELRNLSL